ncbi:bacterial Ig-like domain-containing protein [Lactiplantibacillus pentosus]|uniref:bacterial Ig-like domain-containing protein n=2 Tax=Lactiplantibacillus pentosus TaxID=1589 RepID=UPI001CD4118F|nr:bacterial Ig-like domain-containing protein [Lactiplantibacillus pentosus]MCA1343429.1 bacterial Ig-like domain-containing protein [Lactiplantibacillus pentosus]MCJ8183628.1 bacterial Ig-like domain-containing protein [Lactiplantibacillus pentosus]
MKNNQEYVMMAARKNRRFWLAAGTALLVWQVNNQTAQADVQQTPTSSADTTVVTANATAASNVVQLQSGTKTSTKTTPTAESTKTDSTSPQQSGSDSQATSASGTASSAAKTGESGQAASDLTAEADNRAKSVSTTPYTDGDNAVENKQNTTTVTTSADKSATRSQSTTETGTTPAQSVETDKAGYAGDSVPVDSATKADQVNDTSLSNDGYDAVSTDVNSSQPSETDKTGTDKTQSSTDGIDSQTVTDEKTSAGLTADSLSSLQPRLAQVQASSLQLDTVDAAPTVAQDYAAWDAITDTTRKGIMGTSEWWIDDSDNTLHLGAGQLADANVQFDDNAEVTDWGNVGWGQYVEAHNAKLTLALEGSIAVGTNARGLFNGLTFDLSNEEDPKTYFSQISVEQTTDMSYMFERVTFMTSWVALNLWSSSADSVNASHMFENVRCIGNADRDKRVLVALPALAEAYSDTSYMFNNSGFSSIAMATSASDASKLTSQVTSMAYMFNNCTQLMSLDLSKFDTHNVTDMSHMFNGDENLGKLVISTYSPNNPDQTFDTSNVTNMSHMFTRCDALGNLDVSGFMTSKVTNMSHMFEYCYATTLDVANFDTSQVTDMQAMFNNAVHVKTLDLSNFDTHLITNMDNMFTNCESLTSLILPTHFVDQQVTSMKQMFTNCATLTSIDLVDDFDTRNVTNMDQLFSGCQKLTSLDVSQLDTSHITNMADFFNDCESLTNIEGLTHLNTASVTTMANMFSNCRSLTALDLSNFETSRVTTMANMFNNCASLPALDVSSLDTSQVVNMANMFAGCAALSALDTTPLKTTNVTNMSGMFKGDRALVSLDISKLGTGQVTTMSHMFEDVFADQKVQSFTGLEKLDTSNVTDMSYMFAGFFLPVAMSLNLVNFDTRKVLNMQGMFKGYVNFKDNYLSYLQTGNVTDMSYMLSGLVNHTQFTWSNNLDTHSVTTMAYMFSDSPDMETFVWKQQLSMDQVTDMQGMFANDIALVHVDFDQFDTSQVTDMTAMFSGDTRLATLDLTSFDTSNVESMYKMFYLDSALKNLNLSSFSGEKLQLTYATLLPLRVFGLFNLIMDDTNDSEPQMGLYQTHLNTLILGQKTRLSLSKPTSVIDWVDASTAEGKEIIAEFSTVEALEQALAQFGLKPDWLVSADLAPSQGFDGVWINNATAETLTSEQLMARYDGTNSLATDATWTWQNILGKDLQVISGTNSTWAPKDSLAGLIDTSKTVDDLTTTVTDATTNQTLTSSQLNALLQQPAHSGEYQVAYQYTDGDGTKQISVPVTLSLVANQSLITTKDSVLQLGTTWTAADNIASLLDADGSVTDLTKVNGVVSVNGIENGTVGTTIPGVYQIDYQITDSTGTVRTATATVIVNGLTLKETQVNVSTDDRWDPLTNIDKAIDDQGNEATVELTITDANDAEVANIKKPGSYQLNYHFTDAHGEHTATAAVNVKADENHADLQVKDSRVYQFGTWTPTDNFVSAMDSDGETLDISALSVTGTVDLNQVGKYTITYQFTDQFGVAHSAQATVEVLENQAAISLDNNSGTLYANGIWNPASVVVNATDVDGSTVEDARIKCSGTVDMTTPGENKLTYSFVDSLGKEHSKDTTVMVLENLAGIKVKSTTESFRIGAKWSEENNFDSATDVDGTSVDLSNVAIESTVNSEVVGQYKVTYSFTDQQGQLRSIVVPVEVLANLADIRVKSKTESFRIGAKWSAEDNFDSATDVDGTPLGLSNVDVKSTVNTEVVGQYKVTYSFTDQQGKLRSVEVPVEVLANLAGIKAKSATESFRIGAKWSAKDNFDGATDVDGTPIDLADVDITSTVDPEKVGQYKVTYSFTDQQGELRSVEVPVEVLANLAGIRVKSTTESFRIGAKWSAKDNFESATNVDGTAVALSDVDVTSTVDPETVGQYKVTYSFTDQQGKLRSVEVPVEVLANLAGIRVKFTTESFRIGAKWSAKDNFDSATDVDGTPINLSNIDIESTVNLEVAGQYKVTYSFTDQQGKLRNVEVPVDVLANMAGIKVKSKTESFRIGAKWSEKDNFDGATDVDGTPIDLADVDVISTVDPEKVGQYKVTYSFTDQQGQLRKAEVPVEVLANLAGIKVKFTTESFRIGAKWSAEDNFDSATDVDGTPINLSNIDVENTVNSERVGQYKVTYSFIDQQGELRSIEVPVEVLANLAGIKVKSTAESFRIGAKWSEEDNFDSATDVDGTPINLSNIDIESTVNSEVAGQYKVTYSFTDQQGKLRSAEVPVGVLANLAGIKVKSTTESFRIGAKWSEKDNFDSATDVDGTPINLSNIDIESTVNSEVVGQYKVTYSFTDQQGKLRSVEVPVEVLANLAGIRVKSTTESFRIGATWSEKDNFDGATDVDGTPIDLADVDITSTVDPEKVGQYKVTYSFTDQQGELRSVEVPVEVLANLASIKVKSTTESFRIGEKWSEENNFDSATDVDGTPLGLSNVDVESTVNPEVVGQYKVTYSFTDQQGQLRKADVTVNVLANLAGIKVKASTENFRIGAKWSEKDNFDSATDVDGTPIDLADVNIISTVDPKAVGKYEVTYSFTDQQGQIRSVEVPVEVLANLAGIKVKSATESFRIGAKWSGKDNFESATNVDGTAVALSDVDVTSTVDPEKVGQYKVTYSFIDQQGQLRKAEVTVDVLANLAGIKVKSTTESFRIGAKWSEKDNFDSATDVDGTPINLADVNITSTVDSTAVGQYKVTYSFTDQQGKLRSIEVPVEVLANLAGIKVKSTAESFRIGAKWSEKDNFDCATNVDGTAVALSDVDITSTVDSKAVGQYMVTYSFTDQQGTVQQVIVPVNVLANYANLQLNQTELSFRAGDNRW